MLRLYREGDEAGILELFREVSGRTRSLAHWQWKYRDNPAGSILPALAEDEDGRIVGHYVTIPAWARMDGKPCQVIQVIDAMVAASQRRGLKKPGLFVRKLPSTTVRSPLMWTLLDPTITLDCAPLVATRRLPNVAAVTGATDVMLWTAVIGTPR